MTLPLEDLPKAAFNGIEFPITEVTVKGGIREHTHEFAHSDEWEDETLGRKPYMVTMHIAFHIISPSPDGQRDLWPDQINGLFQEWNDSENGELYIPTVGIMSARAIDFERTANFSVLTGEDVVVTFKETRRKPIELFNIDTDVDTKLIAAQAELAAIPRSQLLLDISRIFDKIEKAVAAVQRVVDTPDKYAAIAESKIAFLSNLCREADAHVTMQDPNYAKVMNALHDLWAASNTLAKNVAKKLGTIQIYVVPVEMPVTTIASAIYGDSDRTMEILQLNPIEDAFAVPAGTRIRFLK